MTNEEIEQAMSERMAAKLGNPHYGRPVELYWRHVEVAASEAARELVSQAYEEAARACCVGCELGERLERNEKEGWMHVLGDTLSRPCAAHGIRLLKESLVQEPVSSPS